MRDQISIKNKKSLFKIFDAVVTDKESILVFIPNTTEKDLILQHVKQSKDANHFELITTKLNQFIT